MPWETILNSFGLAIFLIIAFAAYVLIMPEKFESFLGLIARLISQTGSTLSKKSLSLRMESRINSFAATAFSHTRHIEPIGVKAKWIETEADIEAALNVDGDLIIHLDPTLSDGENLARAALAFVDRQFISEAKCYLTPRQKLSLDLYVTGEMLGDQNDIPASEFYRKVLSPLMREDEKICELIGTFRSVDEAGYLYAIFVEQLVLLGEKAPVSISQTSLHEEISRLLSWLTQWALRRTGDDSIPMNYQGKFISCVIILIAKQETSPNAYINSALGYIGQQYESLYFLGDNERYGSLIFDVVSEVKTRIGYKYKTELDTVQNCKYFLPDGRPTKASTRIVHLRTSEPARYIR